MVAGSIIECRCRKKKKEREGEKKKGVKAPLHPLTSLFFFGGVGGGQSRRVRKGGVCVCGGTSPLFIHSQKGDQ